MTLDMFLWAAGVTAEGSLIALLWRKSVPQSMPVFFAYLCWSFATDIALYSLQAYNPSAYPRFYWTQMVIDSMMVFAVLVELAWSVLKPIRASLPRRSWIAIAVLIAVAGLLLWPLAGLTVPAHMAALDRGYFRLQQTFAILRVVVFLAMAGFSQLLSIGWRNRESPDRHRSGLLFHRLPHRHRPPHPPGRHPPVPAVPLAGRGGDDQLFMRIGLLGAVLCHQGSRAPRIHSADAASAPGRGRRRQKHARRTDGFRGRQAAQARVALIPCPDSAFCPAREPNMARFERHFHPRPSRYHPPNPPPSPPRCIIDLNMWDKWVTKVQCPFETSLPQEKR